MTSTSTCLRVRSRYGLMPNNPCAGDLAALPPGVTLAIPTLCPGGAEKVMVDLANFWVGRGRPVCLVTFDDAPSPFALDPSVRRIALDALPVPDGVELPAWPHEAGNVHRLRLALALAGHKAVLSFLPRMNMRVLLAAEEAHRVTVCERTHPPMMPLGAWDEALRRRLYPLAHRVVCLTRRTRNAWAASFVPSRRLLVIPNAFVPAVHGGEERAEPVPGPYVLAAGRLSPEKGFDRLLAAWGTVRAAHPALRLVIAGEGPQRARLEALARSLGLGESVFFPGFVPFLEDMMRTAAFFVLPSRFEGFPNVLLEAMGSGCPPVAFDCLTGPGELIRHGENGLLVPPDDVHALASAMLRMVEDETLRTRIGASARKVRRRFGRDRVMALWERAVGLETVAGPAGAPGVKA